MNNSTNSTTSQPDETLNIYYVVCEILVAIFAVIGNALVIFVFRKERRLRRRTNYYIVSLAAADFLVGLLGIPFAIMASIGLPTNLYACLFTVSLLVVLCTISIFCLLAVSVDRYWAILYPMGYSRNVRTKTALVIISLCWFVGSVIGFLPLMGWHKAAPIDGKCYFLSVMDYNFLVFLYFGTIITPAILLAGFYAHIYQVVLKQLRQIVTMHPENGSSKGSPGGAMIRILGVAQTNEVKATQNLAIIVLFFMVCWIPLYTVNCVIAFSSNIQINSNFMYSCIILSHLNSAGNPLLYAYHLRDFRAALKNFFCSLFAPPQYCDPLSRAQAVSNNNYSQFRYRRESGNPYNISYDSRLNYQSKPAASKISSIVKNSAAVVVATTCEANRDIWNIPEDSGSSNDSLKEASCNHHDKMLMIRPATPYRPKTITNKAYIESSNVGSDEVEDPLPYHDYIFEDYDFETSLNDSMMRTVRIVPSSNRASKCLSSSSPQISRGLFLVEKEAGRPGRSSSLVETKEGSLSDQEQEQECRARRMDTRNFSPFKVVNFFKGKKSLSRSLSDEGHVSMESLTGGKSNSYIGRNSCGN